MRHLFAQQSILVMDAGADLRVPGGAITVALCGHWEHDPPCPLAAHHTGTERLDDQVRVRTLFATEPDNETAVRRHIADALSVGRFQGPDGSLTRWRLVASEPSQVRTEERDHGARLTAG